VNSEEQKDEEGNTNTGLTVVIVGDIVHILGYRERQALNYF